MSNRIEAGTYTGRAVAGSEQYGQTSNGNDQVVIELELTELGEKVSTFLVFSDKSAPYAIQRLRALGWTGNNLGDLRGIDRNEVPVSVRYEEYKGELKMKVEIVTAGGVVLQNQLDDKGKKAFAAKYASLVRSTPGGNAAPAARQAPAKRTSTQRQAPAPASASGEDFGGATGTDDDIPF